MHNNALQRRCSLSTFATLLSSEHHCLLQWSLFRGVHSEVDQRVQLMAVISVGHHLGQLWSVSTRRGGEGRHKAANALLRLVGVLRRQSRAPLATAAPAKGQADEELLDGGEDHLKAEFLEETVLEGRLLVVSVEYQLQAGNRGQRWRLLPVRIAVHWTPSFGVRSRQAAFQGNVKEVRQFGELHENGAHRMALVEEMDCAQVDKGVGKVVDGEETDRFEGDAAEEVKVGGHGEQRLFSSCKRSVVVRLHVDGHQLRAVHLMTSPHSSL